MPVFEYMCSACGGQFELLVRTSERDSVPCPRCKKPTLERQLSAFAVVGGEGGKGRGASCRSCSSSSCSTCG